MTDRQVIEIDDASRLWFFSSRRHDIGEHLIVALSRLRTAENPRGFYDRELTKHTPDWKQIFDYGLPGVSVRSRSVMSIIGGQRPHGGPAVLRECSHLGSRRASHPLA